MKALSLKQPWASLIALGRKTVECRSWQTHYRGPLAICASTGLVTWARDELAPDLTLPRGVIVCVVDLVDVVPWSDGHHARHAMVRGDGYAWLLENARHTTHAQVKGKLMLFEIADTLARASQGTRIALDSPSVDIRSRAGQKRKRAPRKPRIAHLVAESPNDDGWEG